jgi:predicted SnoaL-like aldol condensation-catalyzing enzyme
VIGKEAMRDWWKDSFDRLPSLNYKVTSLTANSDRVFMEYVRSVDNEEDILVAEVLEVRDNKIVLSRVYHA